MKRFFSVLMMAVLLSTINSMAQGYGLKIAGNEIDASNASDILKKIGKGTGKMSYDAPTHTLTLENVVLDAGAYKAIETDNSLPDFTIILKGENSITQNNERIDLGSIKNKITGDGTLKVKSNLNAGIYLDESELLITGNCTVEVEGAWGICGYDDQTGSLIVEGATVKATGRLGSICDMKELILRDCIITVPSDAAIIGGAVVANGNLCTSQVIIEKIAKNYNIKVNGIEVTQANAADILGDGKISYDAERKTLSLDNATIAANDQPAIATKSDIIITLKGTNKMSSNNEVFICEENTLINGNGSIALESKNGAAIKTHKNLTIDAIEKFSANGKYGIIGTNTGNTNRLLLKKTTVDAKGSEGSICMFSDIAFERCHIFQPQGAVVSNGGVTLNGTVCKEKIVIGKTIEYPLFLGGKSVTSENYGDIFNDGTAVYDIDRHILTLNNFKYETQSASSGISALSTLGNLTIILKGNNVISTPYHGAIFTCNTTIKGEGTLKITSTGSIGMIVNGIVLTIENGKDISVEGDVGISGFMESRGDLILNNTTLRAKGAKGSMIELASLSLDKCKIKQPSGAVFNNDTKRVEINGQTVTEQIIIEPNSTDMTTPISNKDIKIWGDKGILRIDFDKSPNNTKIRVYNIKGELVQTTIPSTKTTIILPTGIYIVKVNDITEKVIVK